MSAPTQIKSSGLVSHQIKIDGSVISEVYQVFLITIEKSINRISSARILILDGSAAKESFAVSNTDIFVPGKSITIEAGYSAKNKPIFTGVITKQALRVDGEIGSALEIECKDEAVKMTIGRKSANYTKSKDSDVISQLIGNYSGLSADVTSTSTQLPELVQYYSSDWDFMLTRAEVNSLVVTTLNSKVSVFSPTQNTSPVLTIRYGENMYGFNAELNSVTQLSEVKASAWDYKQQQLISAQASNSLEGAGNLTSKKLADVVGLSEFQLQTSGAVDSNNLTNWAEGQMLKSELAKIIGEVRFQGTDLVDPGAYITIDGMGARFDGDHLVSAVRHDISDGNWFVDASIGLTPTWFAQEPDVMAPPAAGMLPGVNGLYNATVKKINDDPDSEYRILIDLPLFDPSAEGVWARLTNFYSTSGAGAFFLPEVGDEVVVGFLNDDPRFPIILGSLYSSKNKPFSELEPNEQNSHKAIVSKQALRVVFNDEDKILTVTTPNKNTCVLDDKNKQISLTDENQNSIVMSESGITIKSEKSINIQATENVNIQGETGVAVKAPSGDVKTSAMNINESADMQYTAKGDMTASVEGGTELTLKAAMVMIN